MGIINKTTSNKLHMKFVIASILAAAVVAKDTMSAVGKGYCNAGYYAGWDKKGIKTQEACNKVCLDDPKCTFAAWKKDATCSRYKNATCVLTKRHHHHFTFKKNVAVVALTSHSSAVVHSNGSVTKTHHSSSHSSSGSSSHSVTVTHSSSGGHTKKVEQNSMDVDGSHFGNMSFLESPDHMAEAERARAKFLSDQVRLSRNRALKVAHYFSARDVAASRSKWTAVFYSRM